MKPVALERTRSLTRHRSAKRHRRLSSMDDRPPPPPPKDEAVALMSDPRIFRTQTGGIGFACSWKIDWSQYDEERGTSWLFTTGLHRKDSQRKWRPCFALPKSALEQAAYEEMGRREAWDKEYENRFHLCPNNEYKKEEERRRASWDEDYCNLLTPANGNSSPVSRSCFIVQYVKSIGARVSQCLCSDSCLPSSWRRPKSTTWLPDAEPQRLTTFERRSDTFVIDGLYKFNEKFVF